MFSFRFCLLCLISISLFNSANLVSAVEKSDEEAARLVKVLNSATDTYNKAMACRRLAAIGDAKSVPAIAKYLGDEKLATYARSALENIPGPASDQALEESLKSVKGDQLVGVINSIGKRKDKNAAAELAKLLSDKNTKVAIAAAHALGAIGTKEAATALQQALGKGEAKVQNEVGFACLMCARSLSKTDKQTAITLTTAVRTANLPENIKLAATQQAIVLQGKAGLGLLAEELKADDLSRFRSALQAARDLGNASSSTLISAYPSLSDERKALIIAALSLAHDPAALPLVREAATKGSGALQLQAINSLGELDVALDESAQLQVLGDLFGLVKQNHPEIADAAEAVIIKFNSSQPASQVKSSIETNTRKLVENEALPEQLAGLQLAGECRISSLTPTVLQLVAHSNPEVKQAAITALGGTTSSTDLPKLIAVALKNPSD
ncbi:MAG: HEAT repeat domain-containing protein, partial [Planctomycetaceae bacterium]|nr:HEAT repeat domain-containing protein [Planctomycetaceae bacterium]